MNDAEYIRRISALVASRWQPPDRHERGCSQRAGYDRPCDCVVAEAKRRAQAQKTPREQMRMVGVAL